MWYYKTIGDLTTELGKGSDSTGIDSKQQEKCTLHLDKNLILLHQNAYTIPVSKNGLPELRER